MPKSLANWRGLSLNLSRSWRMLKGMCGAPFMDSPMRMNTRMSPMWRG